MKRLLLIYFALSAVPAFAQKQSRSSDRNNVFKLVLTPKVLYPNSYVFSYERVVKSYQSVNLTGGVVQFPRLFSGSKHFVTDSEVATGYTVGADYRFYLKSENKYEAPHGVYLGPFVSYYWFSNERMIRDASAAVSSGSKFDSKVSFSNIGVQLGYQFVIKDRWTIDIVFIGPSITNYKLKLNLDGTFTVDQENEIVKELLDRFPLLKDFIDDESLTVHGSNSKWAPGYRFSAMIGYKFGFGKKRR